MLDNTTLESKQQKLLLGKQLFDVELSTKCNKKCPVCPRDKFARPIMDMDDETFAKFVQWVPEDCYVMFAGFGEPLLNKKIFKYISQLKSEKKRISISVYTNGIMLNDMVLQELFDSGLDLIQLSVLGKEDFPLTKKILEIIDQKGYINRIRINILYGTKLEHDELRELIKINFPTFISSFFLKKIHNRGGMLYDYKYCGELKSCGTFFMDTFIDVQGNIQMCSNDINGENVLGNISTLSFDEVVRKKKKLLGNIEISPLCQKCSDEYRLLHFAEVE